MVKTSLTSFSFPEFSFSFKLLNQPHSHFKRVRVNLILDLYLLVIFKNMGNKFWFVIFGLSILVSGSTSIEMITTNWNSGVVDFIEEGSVADTAGLAHIHLNLSFQPLVDMCRTLEKGTWKHDHIRLMSLRRFRVCHQLDDVVGRVSKHPSLQREKRSLWSGLTKIFAWMGLDQVWSLLSGDLESARHQIIHIKQQEHMLHRTLVELANQTTETLRKMYARLEDEWIERRILDLEVHAQMMIQGWVSALQGRLHPSLLDPVQATVVLKKVIQAAELQSMDPAVKEIAQMYQLPVTSFFQDPYLFHLVIHVPLTRKTFLPFQMLRLYSHQIIWDSSKRMVAEISSLDRLLVSEDMNKYAILSVENLKRCARIDEMYFCENLLVTKNADYHCLTQIYKQQPRKIATACQMTVHQPDWAVIPVTNQWMAFSKEILTYQLRCHNGTEYTRRLQEFQALDVPPGCFIQAPQFVLHGPPIGLTMLRLVPIPFRMPFGNDTTSALLEEINKGNKTFIKIPEIGDTPDEEPVSNVQWHDHLSFSVLSVLSMIGVILVVVSLVCCQVKVYQKQASLG